MRLLRTTFSCLALLAGLAAISIPVSGSAAARGCSAKGPSVCGIKADGPANFANACAAKAAGARVMHPGDCQPVLCMGWMAETTVLDSKAICGTDPLNHQMMTYPNVCAEEHAMANFVHAGPCKGKRR